MKTLSILLTALLSTIPTVAFGQFSTLIESDLSRGDLNQFLNTVYLIAISAAALIAVIKIILAGVKYMLTDIVTSKEDAKKDIRTSLLGLIVVMSAILILYVINPRLTDFDLQFTKPGENFEREPSREGKSPAPVEFAMSRYDETDWNFCITFDPTGGILTAIYNALADDDVQTDTGGAFCSEYIVLDEKYKTEQGTTVIYNAYDQCIDEFAGPSTLNRQSIIDKIFTGNTLGQSCVNTVKELFEEPCGARGGNTCDQGWCIHNAGQVVSTGNSNTFGCRLPYKRFTYNEVEAAFKESGQSAISFGEEEFKIGCRALQGTVADIELNYFGSNQRCVQR